MRHGSSNAYKFAVPPLATPHRSGQAQTDFFGVTIGWSDLRNDNTLLRMWMSREPGELVLWDYAGFGITTPEIWVIANSSNIPQYVWENDEKVDPYRDSLEPYITQKQDGTSIIPGSGHSVRATVPSYSSDASNLGPIDTLKSEAESAASPAWISNTPYSSESNANLINLLFRRQQEDRKLRVFDDLDDALAGNISLHHQTLLNVLYLRALSMVRYDHRGETCVPLILNRWTVDTDGIVVLV